MVLQITRPAGYDIGAYHVCAILNEEERLMFEQLPIPFLIPELPERVFRQFTEYMRVELLPGPERRTRWRGAFIGGVWHSDFYTNGVPEERNRTPVSEVRAALIRNINEALQTIRDNTNFY